MGYDTHCNFRRFAIHAYMWGSDKGLCIQTEYPTHTHNSKGFCGTESCIECDKVRVSELRSTHALCMRGYKVDASYAYMQYDTLSLWCDKVCIHTEITMMG
jgi:hypothetical protein